MHLESYSYTRKETTTNTEVLLDLNFLTSYPLNCSRLLKRNFLLLVEVGGPFITGIQMQHELDERCSNCPPISSSQLFTFPWVNETIAPGARHCTKSLNSQILNSRRELSYLCLCIHNTRKHKFRTGKDFACKLCIFWREEGKFNQ